MDDDDEDEDDWARAAGRSSDDPDDCNGSPDLAAVPQLAFVHGNRILLKC